MADTADEPIQGTIEAVNFVARERDEALAELGEGDTAGALRLEIRAVTDMLGVLYDLVAVAIEDARKRHPVDE